MFCQKCGKNVPDSEVKIVKGKTLCSECAKENIPKAVKQTAPHNEFVKEEPKEPKESRINIFVSQVRGKMNDLKDKFEQFVSKVGKKRLIIISSSVLAVLAVTIVLLVLGLKYHLFCKHEWLAETCSSPKTCAKCGETEGVKLEHEWSAADCENPEICQLCGEKRGQALGHKWEKATCSKPETCSVCQKTKGTKLEHQWKKATCEEPETCMLCDKTNGKAKGHKWKDATCDKPKTCSVCSKTDGKAKGHKWSDATCEKPKTCSVCKKTEGKKSGHKWVDATVIAPKTCSVCGEKDGSALSYDYIGIGKVSTDSGGLNMRRKPDTDSEKVTLIPQNSEVNIYNCNNPKWYYVEYDGNYGYASSEFIQYRKMELDDYVPDTYSSNVGTTKPNNSSSDSEISKFCKEIEDSLNDDIPEGHEYHVFPPDNEGDSITIFYMQENKRQITSEMAANIYVCRKTLDSGYSDFIKEEYAKKLQKLTSLHEESNECLNDICISVRDEALANGFNYNVQLSVLDPDDDTYIPYYWCVNGEERLDMVDILLEKSEESD